MSTTPMRQIESLSVIVPVYNEEPNLKLLYERLMAVLMGLPQTYEVLFMDDGSTDGSGEALDRIAANNVSVKVIHFRRNYGQTAALAAGFRFATGEAIVALDADLQNDPADIPPLLAKLAEGYDVVSGWRRERKDNLWTRKIPSWAANKIIGWISGLPLKDYGCTLRAYRAPFVKDIHLIGEMHRFIPLYAHWMGAKIAEVPVRHHARLHGKSKYGLIRTFKVLLDMVTVKFLGDYSTKPIYVFGGFGLLSMTFGILASGVVLIQKFFYGVWAHRNPVLSVSIFFLGLGFQLVLMGVLAEMVIRIYHESSSRQTYWIRNSVNLDHSPTEMEKARRPV